MTTQLPSMQLLSSDGEVEDALVEAIDAALNRVPAARQSDALRAIRRDFEACLIQAPAGTERAIGDLRKKVSSSLLPFLFAATRDGAWPADDQERCFLGRPAQGPALPRS